MKTLKQVVGAIVIMGFIMVFDSCQRKESPVDIEDEILAAIERSNYANPEGMGFHSNESKPQGSSSLSSLLGELPEVRFGRVLESKSDPSVEIEISEDSMEAYVTLERELQGMFYVDSDLSDGIYGMYARPFTDVGRRTIYLQKVNTATGVWQVKEISPVNIVTQNSTYNLEIEKVELTGSSGTFTITDPTQVYAKEELPIFLPTDTVYVTTTLKTGSDSAWAFLHHGGWQHHQRVTTTSDDSLITFTVSWAISSDSISSDSLPTVRHAAIDYIAWNTLFGDSSATYGAHGWAIPYIVKGTDDEVPED